MATPENTSQKTNTERVYESGREGFVLFYDRFERMATAEVPLPKGKRLQDVLNEKERQHPRDTLELDDAEFYVLNPEDMKYYKTEDTQRKGRSEQLTMTKGVDIIYPLKDFRDEEEAKSVLENSYKIKVAISLHRLDGDIEGEVILKNDYKGKSYRSQLKDIIRRRTFVAIINPKNKDLESRILQATGEVISRPVLLNTYNIRNVNVLEDNSDD